MDTRLIERLSRYLVLTGLVVVAGCTWVDLTEGAKSVTVVSAVNENCERLGSTTSRTKAEVASVERSPEKVSEELTTLARNAAARMGGDTISADSEVNSRGEQTFGIYRCGADAVVRPAIKQASVLETQQKWLAGTRT